MARRVREIPSTIPTALDRIELVDEATRATVELVHARGGIATRFAVGDREILYLDDSTLADRTKNVRGGNPVLFPSPGKLTSDKWKHGDHEGSMKQHGFARNLPWRLASVSGIANLASASLSLESNEITHESWPWDFGMTITYSLLGTTLRAMAWIQNRSADPMPFGFGFHPYFLVKDKAAANIATQATRAFDNVTKKLVDFAGFEGAYDLRANEVDVHLEDHGGSEATLTFGDADGGGQLKLRGTPEFTHWVVWSVAGKDYVCLEPWTCPGDALNTGDRIMTLAPAEARVLGVDFEFTPKGA